MWVNLTNLKSEPLVSDTVLGELTRGTLILNARVQMEPELLEELVRKSLIEVAARFGVEATVDDLQCFSPAYPTPPNVIREKVEG